MKVRAYGKINLSLYITGTRGNLHTLDSVMTTVSLFDELTVEPSDSVRVTCGAGIPSEENTAFRAAKLVEEASGLKLDIKIEKGIPVGGGMGGSSADGAAVLFCASELIGDAIDLRGLSAKLGSDAYFMTRGGSCRVTGTGDEISRISCAPDFSALIVDCGSVSTPECYRTFDRIGERNANRNDELTAALRLGRMPSDALFCNDLFSSARFLNARISDAERIMLSAGAAAHLTGSGGCLFAIGPSEGLEAKLTEAGFSCLFVTCVPRGVEIIDRDPKVRQ